MKQRIYLVRHKPPGNTKPFLVRAISRASALHYVSAKLMEVELAEQDTLVELLGKGHSVEQAGEEQLDLPVDEGARSHSDGAEANG